jgi:hypothetical protein
LRAELRYIAVNEGACRYPELPGAIEAAASRFPPLEELGDFEERWDLQHLRALVKEVKKHQATPIRNIKDVITELDRWNAARNKKAHDSIPGTERQIYTDEQLGYYFIEKAKPCLLRTNGWNQTSEEARRIVARLNELQACLDGEDVLPSPHSPS